MAIKVASNFQVGTGLPVDDRFVFETIAGRDKLESGRLYVGLLVYVKETKKYYVYDGGWKEFITGVASNESALVFDVTMMESNPDIVDLATYKPEERPHLVTIVGENATPAAWGTNGKTMIAVPATGDNAKCGIVVIQNLSNCTVTCSTALTNETRYSVKPNTIAAIKYDASTLTLVNTIDLNDIANKTYVDTAKTEAVNTAKTYTDDEVQKVKESMNGLLAANDAMVFKGTIGSTDEFGAVLTANEWKAGWTWKMSAEVKELYLDSPALEVGDMIIAAKDHPATAIGPSNPYINDYFDFIQANVDGAVTASGKATSGNIAVFDGTSGRVISGKAFDDIATYTNATPTTAELGGIPKGTTFKDKPLSEIVEMLLYPISVSLSTGTARTFEKGTTLTASLTVEVKAGSKAITSVGLYNGETSLKALEAKEGTQSASISITAATTVTAKAGDGTNTATSDEVTFTAVDPFYAGVVATAPTTGDAVKALSKKVEAKGEKKIAHTTTASAGRYCFCYPKAHGALKTVLDGNGFDNTSDYDVSTVSVTTAAGETVDYYVYTYKNVVVPGTMKMTYKF